MPASDPPTPKFMSGRFIGVAIGYTLAAYASFMVVAFLFSGSAFPLYFYLGITVPLSLLGALVLLALHAVSSLLVHVNLSASFLDSFTEAAFFPGLVLLPILNAVFFRWLWIRRLGTWVRRRVRRGIDTPSER